MYHSSQVLFCWMHFTSEEVHTFHQGYCKDKGRSNKRLHGVFNMDNFCLFYLCWSLNLCLPALNQLAFHKEVDGISSSLQVSEAVVFENKLLQHWFLIFYFFSQIKRIILHILTYLCSLVKITWKDTEWSWMQGWFIWI